MTTLTLLLACVAAIIGIARIHHSNKLFWALTVSMLLGFGLGSIVKSSYNRKEINSTTVTSMQGSSALTILDPAMLPDNLSTKINKRNLVTYVKPASKMHVDCDIELTNRTGTHFNPEDDIGIIEPSNTS